MKLTGSSNTTGSWGVDSVLPAGYVVGIMLAEDGKTGAKSKSPNTDKIILSFDIIEGDHAFNYQKWSQEKDTNHYLQMHLSVKSQMAKIVYTLEMLAKETGGQQEQYLKQCLAKEDIPTNELAGLKLKCGAILGWGKSGYIEITELVSIETAKNTPPSGAPRPPQTQTETSNGGFGGGSRQQNSGFGGGQQQQQQGSSFGGGDQVGNANMDEGGFAGHF